MNVHTIINFHSLNELKGYTLNRGSTVIMYVMSCVCVVLAYILCIDSQDYILAAALLVLSFFLPVEIIFIKRFFVNKNLKVIRELYGTDNLHGSITFLDDKMIVYNYVTQGSLPISYFVISKFIETANYYAFYTKQKSIIIMEKNQFSPQERDYFLSIVKTKMPKARYIKGR